MQTTETLFESELKNLIATRIEHLRTEVSAGLIQDMAEYKSKTGMIDGLKAALDMCATARENSQQRNR